MAPLISDAALAADLAYRAGLLLMDLRRTSGLGGAALGAAGDSGANLFVMDALAAHRPDDAILSEETADTPERRAARLAARRVWIVDPLDGTREYAELRDDFAVHVALAIDGAPAVGAVALPARDLVLRSDAPPPLPRPHSPRRIVTSRTRPAPVAERVAAALGAGLLKIGSAGAKAAAIMLGEADAYLHSGAQREWDNCAPVAVACAAGLHCSRLDGSALAYNRANVIIPDLLICHAEDAGRIVANVGGPSTGSG